jgi:hypothetical protein
MLRRRRRRFQGLVAPARLSARPRHHRDLINLLAEDHSHADKRGQHRVVLEPHGYRWYRVGGLDYLLKWSDIDGAAVKGKKHPG